MKCAKCHWIVHFNMVNFTFCDFYFGKKKIKMIKTGKKMNWLSKKKNDFKIRSLEVERNVPRPTRGYRILQIHPIMQLRNQGLRHVSHQIMLFSTVCFHLTCSYPISFWPNHMAPPGFSGDSVLSPSFSASQRCDLGRVSLPF